jgi:hypothetical protein
MTTPEDARQRPLELSERQLQVWRALRAKAQPKYPLHNWYFGALVALESPDDSNPDRLAQAGNSLRELLEKLPRALGAEVIGPDTNVLKQKRETAGAALIRIKEQQFANGWLGQTITIELSSTLEKFEEYVELSNRPSRRERTFAGLKKLDPMMPALPQQLQQEKWQRYNSVSKQLEDFTHHRGSGTDDDFRNCLTQMEDLVLDFMAPVTADDQNELLQIISKGASVSDDEIKAALRLVERRGANYAFFFQNVHDRAWIKPLEAAGYFKTPSLVEAAGEGLVAFPVWWPMVFLRRIAADAPEEVLRILLTMDATNNPQVLNGVVEIASQLPIELAVRLEPMITGYINKPFHV